jgi:molybdate transport system substrate-binding protein
MDPRSRLPLTLCVLVGLLWGGAAQAADVTVSAAASLTNAFKEVAQVFETRHPGTKVLLNFAASDALLQQIAKGAPVDVLATADQETMDKAEAQKLLLAHTRRNFARNTLVVVTPADSKQTLNSLADLQQPGVAKIALGHPASVPAGRYARAALEAARLWPAVETKAVFAQSVRQGLDYVARGEVEAGFVYRTDAFQMKDKVKIAFTVPTEVPVLYPVATLSGGPNTEAGRKFAEFVASAAGLAVLEKYGFQQP